jgi:hypothetical protein
MSGDKPLLIIGLSAENIRRLTDDQPIVFDAADLGLPPMVILVCAGETEDAIAAALREHFPTAPADDETEDADA